MANTSRNTTARRNMNTAGNTNASRNARNMYVEGSAVRKLSEIPDRERRPYGRPPERRRRQAVQPQPVAVPRRTLSKEAQKNREKAMGMNKGFVVFLAAVCTAILFFCVNYLQLKSEITGQMKHVANLEAELTQLKEDNDAYYSQVTSNVDLNRVKKIAIGRLGMRYPSDEQIMTYKIDGGSYVRQYQDIPNSKSR